jgi:hypothetical protein
MKNDPDIRLNVTIPLNNSYKGGRKGSSDE